MVGQGDGPPSLQAQQATPSESLQVIGLISGGKDSFYSLLHCMRNGHHVVALGNLHPPSPTQEAGQDEEDLNSFMYQTVGHTVIPAYERLIGKPLYRQEILGRAVQTTASYANPSDHDGVISEEDETESLTLLLKRIMKDHPEANAVCSGAILSTYQRTRIESVALRLGLVPLAYLWQYTVVRPESQSALLMDMYEAGLDARIVKVASGGLDERNLWMRVTEPKGITNLENKLRRFGVNGDGAVIGEGGEFETIVVDGPDSLFKGRIEIDPKDLKTVSEGGGTEWLQIEEFSIVMKEADVPSASVKECRIPDLLDHTFDSVKANLQAWDQQSTFENEALTATDVLLEPGKPNPHVTNHTFSSQHAETASVEEQARDVVKSIEQFFELKQLLSSNIIASHIILPSMEHFQTVNKYYGSLFKDPNPPARITISCKSDLRTPQKLQIQLTFFTPPPTLSRPEDYKKALHVQSRSYWAPANIGPYSQAVAYPCFPVKPSKQHDTFKAEKRPQDSDSDEDEEQSQPPTWLVKIAGQIPLIPASMALPSACDGDLVSHLKSQTVLSLQHLWRIGTTMDVKWFVGAVAYIPSSGTSKEGPDGVSCAGIVSKAWELVHGRPSIEDGRAGEDDEENEETDEDFDIWHQSYNKQDQFGGNADHNSSQPPHSNIPDWSLLHSVKGQNTETCRPPVFTAMIDSLPRGAEVEWHAFTGIGTGATSIKLQTHTTKDFTIHHLITSSFITHTIISLSKPSSISKDLASTSAHLSESLLAALHVLKASRDSFGKMTNLACLDVRYGDWWNVEGEGVQVVKCTGLWDEYAREIVGFWVLEGVL